MSFFDKSLFQILLLLWALPVFSQDTPPPGNPDSLTGDLHQVYIASVEVSGNKKTKTYIILRELQFKAGDRIDTTSFKAKLEYSRALLYNTNLFSEVELVPSENGNSIHVRVRVLERFYVFPIPQFRLVDRNLNEWLRIHNADLERVIYGARFEHYNLSGRGDKLRLFLLNGYTRSFNFSYVAPYSNGALTEGFSFLGGYAQQREFNFKTATNNLLQQFRKSGFARSAFYLGASYQRRRGFFKRNTYSLTYNYQTVSDSVISPAYNPNYFKRNKPFVAFTDLQYSFQYLNMNNVNYPTKGRVYGISFLKRGLGLKSGVNMFAIDARSSRFFAHQKNFYSSFESFGKLKLPLRQAYINQTAFGYGDFVMRGLEYYVVDATAAALLKFTIRKKIIQFQIPFPFNIKKIPTLPFAIYAKTYSDAGYGFNKPDFKTRLSNTMLYTAGLGVDIVGLYDSTLRLEYSFNQLGENGLFLHIRSGF